MKRNIFWRVMICIGWLSCQVNAEQGKDIAFAQCADCHAFEQVNYEQQTITERIERKAPPLFYAGNKFRRDWLVTWLQDPQRIRPAGYSPILHVVSGSNGDVVDEKTLPQHLKLNQQEAEAVADFLMTLTPYTSRLQESDYQPGDISWRMGNLNFGKFNGCDACHRDAPDYGGLSGPELYTAWQRLQPQFIASFIADPVAWDPHTLMPKNELNPAAVKKLADYLKVNGEEEE